MLHSVKELHGFGAVLADGRVASVDEIYFDDNAWTIRHIVVDTGGWLSGRKVLISPHAVAGVSRSEQIVRVDLRRAQIEGSPGIDTDKPVSRQHEIALYDYYGYPYYWMGPYAWGNAAMPSLAADQAADGVGREISERVKQERERGDPHLRSSKEVIGYRIRATDDEIGHVEDFLFDAEDWSIRMMVVDTRNWWPGKHVLVSLRRIDHVSWSDRNVVVNIRREEIETSPQYDRSNPPAQKAGNEQDAHQRFEAAREQPQSHNPT